MFKRFWNWAKHTSIKSTDEIMAIKDEVLRNKNKNLRSICQLGNIAFSLLSLGIFIPVYTRTQVNKKEREKMEALKKEQQQNRQVENRQNVKDLHKESMDSNNLKIAKNTAFQAFFNS